MNCFKVGLPHTAKSLSSRPHCCVDPLGSIIVANRPTVLVKEIFRPVCGLCLGTALLALSVGCQNDGELANANNSAGRALAPRSIEEYARQRNISNDQARQEVQAAVSKRDADQALKNIDDAGIQRQ